MPDIEVIEARRTKYHARGLWQDNLVDQYLATAAAEDPERPAVIDRSGITSYRDLDAMVNQAASGLLRLGLKRGDVVSWQIPNWLEATVVHYAAMRIGAVSNPIIPIYRAREVEFIVRQSRSKVLVVPDTFRGFNHAEMARAVQRECPSLKDIIVVGSPPSSSRSFGALLQGSDPTGPPSIQRQSDDVMLLLYTSGTTADPKGVQHTHNTLDYENRSIIELYDLRKYEAIFMPSPVSHITGLLYGIQLPPMLHSPAVFLDIWDPEHALDLVRQYKCSFTVGATPFLYGFLETARRRKVTRPVPLKAFACGGADVPPDLVKQAENILGCTVARVYGSTEYPTATGGGPGDPAAKRAETDGPPIGAAEVRVVDSDGRVLPRGEQGELQVRGPELFIGYFDSEAVETSFSGDGWFSTGDRALIDDDGYVQITGRIKDIIVRGGENISAKEVEDLLFEHPDVSEVALVGMPDPVMVERICAFVVPAPGRIPSLREFAEYLSTKSIAKQKYPERIVIVTELPKTASGKVQKFRLREEISRQLAAELEGSIN